MGRQRTAGRAGRSRHDGVLRLGGAAASSSPARRDFRVAGVVPIERGRVAIWRRRSRASATRRRSSDWDPPFPIDLRRIRPVDEQYWDEYRTTPKAFVPLEVGQRAVALALRRADVGAGPGRRCRCGGRERGGAGRPAARLDRPAGAGPGCPRRAGRGHRRRRAAPPTSASTSSTSASSSSSRRCCSRRCSSSSASSSACARSGCCARSASTPRAVRRLFLRRRAGARGASAAPLGVLGAVGYASLIMTALAHLVGRCRGHHGADAARVADVAAGGRRRRRAGRGRLHLVDAARPRRGSRSGACWPDRCRWRTTAADRHAPARGSRPPSRWPGWGRRSSRLGAGAVPTGRRVLRRRRRAAGRVVSACSLRRSGAVRRLPSPATAGGRCRGSASATPRIGPGAACCRWRSSRRRRSSSSPWTRSGATARTRPADPNRASAATSCSSRRCCRSATIPTRRDGATR